MLRGQLPWLYDELVKTLRFVQYVLAAAEAVSVAKSLSPRIRELDSNHHREVEVLKTLGQWSGRKFACLPQDQRP